MQQLSLKYTIGIFLDATEIIPKGDIYARLYDILGTNYVPNTVQEMTPAGMKNRIVMEDQENGVKILFLTNNILIEKYPINITADSIGTIEQFIDDSLTIAESILVHFNKQANRLSILSKHLVKDIPTEDLDAISSRLFHFPSDYNSSNTFEWNWRLVRKEDKMVGETTETLNFLAIVNRIKGKLANNDIEIEFEGIDIEVDINTIAENETYRFNSDRIRIFFEEAKNWHRSHHRSLTQFVLGS